MVNIAKLKQHNITHILIATIGVEPLYPDVCHMPLQHCALSCKITHPCVDSLPDSLIRIGVAGQ